MEKRNVEDAANSCGVPSQDILFFIEQEWVLPAGGEELFFDSEDVARIHLISELRRDFGVNDESMPIILHLLDQLNRMHLELERFRLH